jgi:hypothetical protein
MIARRIPSEKPPYEDAMKDDLLALSYAAIGGAVGHYAFGWILDQGFYAVMLPGGLLGFAAGFARCRSMFVPILCGIAATLLGFYSEWTFRPFIVDGSLEFFVKNIGQLTPITLIMIALGGFLGFWIPYRNVGAARATGTR